MGSAGSPGRLVEMGLVGRPDSDLSHLAATVLKLKRLFPCSRGLADPTPPVHPLPGSTLADGPAHYALLGPYPGL